MSEAQRGEKSWKSKLTEDKVKEIKILLMEGQLTQKEIASKFGIKHGMITNIYKKKYWWWVSVPGFNPKEKYSSGPTNAKLNIEQVKEIKNLLKESGMTQKEIAVKYNVAVQTICLINSGKRWSHIF